RGLGPPDLRAARRHRLARIRAELVARDLAGIVVYDPLNVRYATDSTDMQAWCAHNAVRYAFVATEGPVILWDFHNCEHLSWHLELVDEIRHGTAWFYYLAGEHAALRARRWAAEIADLIARHGGGNRRLAIDKINPEGVDAMAGVGIDIFSGEEVMEHARTVKCADELKAMRRAIAACQASMAVMERALTPGMTENDLWAILHAENIRRGGEWIETRLLSSGPRTNPWFQESSARVIEPGDLVAFDTDLIGAYGYCCDVSRTWLAGDGRPTEEQRALYAMAEEQIASNMAMLEPGRTFRELAHTAMSLPAEYLPNRYSVLFHGVGLCDEYPSVPYPSDWQDAGYDGVLEPGMVVCVESYVGRHGGYEGVKLEQQVLITETGHECLSSYPLDQRLSSSSQRAWPAVNVE
ncbi:MAG: aminopeptidase P family protein, partial [Chloroflexi bacterium]|nr:aminopeptidase P family protein [Chloroflexota bacterium]